METQVIDDLKIALEENDFWPVHDILVYGESMDGDDISDLIEEVKQFDEDLAEEISEMSKTLSSQYAYNEEDFHVPLRELADANDFDWYDQYNVRLTAMSPASFEEDMNGADWRSVTAITEFLDEHKDESEQNMSMYKLFVDVWEDNIIAQADIRYIRDEILDLETSAEI